MAATKKKPALNRSSKKTTKKTTTAKAAAKDRTSNGGKDTVAPVKRGKGEFPTQYMPLTSLVPGKNSRTSLGDITVLKRSIKANGIAQSLVVRPAKKTGKYEVCVGFRRYACATELRLKSVPVIVRDDLDTDMKVLTIQVSENSGDARTQLSPMDQANAFKQLMDADKKITPAKVGAVCGCSDQHVRLMLRLLDAPKKIQNSLQNGDIKTGAAVAVASLPESVQKKIVSEIKPGMSEAQVKQRANEIAAENGVSANPKSKKGRKDALRIVRTRKEMEKKEEELVLAIMDVEEDSGNSDNLKHALASVFWYFGKLETIEIASKHFAKAYKELADLVEEEDSDA